HQRRDHYFRADLQRLAPEVFGEFRSRFDDDPAELVAEREGARQWLRPVTLQNIQVGAAHAPNTNLDKRGNLWDLRRWHGTDTRLGAGAGEGGDADGAVAHGLGSALVARRCRATLWTTECARQLDVVHQRREFTSRKRIAATREDALGFFHPDDRLG